jgi:hypothetical protein
LTLTDFPISDGSAAEGALPHGVAEHDRRLVGARARGEAPQRRLHAQRGEVPGAHQRAAPHRHVVAAADRGLHARLARELRHSCRAFREAEQVRVRAAAAQVAAVVARVHRHQIAAARHGKRAVEEAVHRREERRPHADRDPQRDHAHRHESRRPRQRARGVAHVGQRILHEAGAARVPVIFADAVHAAEDEPRRPPRLLGRHTGAHVLFRLHLQVELDLFAEARLHLSAAEEGAPAAAQQGEQGLGMHGPPQVVRRISSTARA